MADEHFFPGESFPSGLGAAAAPFFSSASYAPPGLDAAVMQGFGMAWAAELRQLPDSSASAVAAAHFDSALSSLVSSPAHNAGGDDAAVIGDLIGRLGSICNGAAAASASNSCYSTPVSSPPRAGAAASPAALAAFRGGGYPAGAAAIETVAGNGSLSRVSSSKSLGAGAAVTPGTASPDPAAETSAKVGGNAAADPTPPAKARKRKAAGKGKAAAATSAMTAAAVAANASPKRSKVVEGGSAGEGKDDDDGEATAVAVAPEPEPAKDYIHVRARRGQATDSHSLAERVRRERISERMKMLQSLVPGCNKITGKALMLDEIINYVQSLQHQVEFLSMKLATMSPAELDADARYQPTAATMPPAAAAAFSSYATAAADLPPFATAAHPAHHHQLLDTTFFGWEAQDLQSVVVAAVHGHDVYASPAPHDGFHGK
ncbi:unnamed protein product [Urochloa humidicola]